MSLNLPPVVKSLAVLVVSGVSAWALMKVVMPSEADLVKKLPESNPVTYERSRSDAQKAMDALKAAANDPEPIYLKQKKK